MAEIKKPSVHAPWRKRNLVPLWFFQLVFAGFQFAWSLTLFSLSFDEGPYPYLSSYQKASSAVNMVLGLVLLGVIITSIVKFSKFRLTSADYKRETILAVVIGVVSIAFSFSAFDFFGGIFVACEVLFSIWLMVYAILVRRRVLKDTVEEMKRPATIGGGDVELEVGVNKATPPAGQPLSHQPPSQNAVGPKVVLGFGSQTRSVSQTSVAICRDVDTTAKEVREFV